MGTQKTKSPSQRQSFTQSPMRLAGRILVSTSAIAAAVSMFTLGSCTSAQAQTNSLIPRFTNTIQAAPRIGSPTVNMKLAQSSDRIAPANTPRPRSFMLPTRYRRQDGDMFGEDQAGGGQDPFGETVESPITESPFKQPTPQLTPQRMPQPTLQPRNVPQSRGTQQRNLFGEPTIEDPRAQTPRVDPSPRVPPMDTSPVAPRLPRDAEFTPDEDSIPDLPTPIGGTRESDKARTERSTEARTERSTEDRNVEDPDGISIEDFNDDNLEENDPQSRRTRSPRSRDTTPRDDDPRRPFRSNVYRPAPDPSYYTNPTGAHPYSNPRTPGVNPYANPYAANPNAANAFAANPYAANPYAPNPYAMNPYVMNPYMNPYMNQYAAMGCPPCNMCAGCPPNNGCNGCGSGCPSCPPTASANSFAGCPTPTPAGNSDGVYESVVGSGNLGITGRSLNNPLMPSGVPLYYVSLFGGLSDLSDLEIVNDDGRINLDSQNGVGLGFAIGQIQGKNLRSELEFSYRNQDIDDLFLSDFAGGRERIDGVGDIESYAGMLNIYWEFVDLCSGRLSPYIGAGVGAVNVSADMRLDGGIDAFNDGEDSSFAYQYIVGVNYKVRTYSDFFVEYRHFAADSLRFDTSLPAGSLLNGDGELNYQTNNIFFGMRLKF